MYIINQNGMQKVEEPETLDYQFPTQLPETPGALTPYQKQLIEFEFVQHRAFQNRRIVTFLIVALCVATLVAHIATHGINRRAAFATVVALIVAFSARNYSIPKR